MRASLGGMVVMRRGYDRVNCRVRDWTEERGVNRAG